MRTRSIVLPSLLLAAVFALACGADTPSAPSPVPALIESPAPPPPPVADFSALAGVWKLTVRWTEVTGSGCVADTMRSQIGEPKPYTLAITPIVSTVSVAFKSLSDDRACTYSPVADSSGFTTYGQGGYYSCQGDLVIRCSDGTQHNLFTFGEDIAGHLSNDGMTGTWGAAWFEGHEDYDIETKAQFTGTR